MKIAIVMPRIYFSPGGGAKVIFEYANYLATTGNCITIFSMNNGNFRDKPIPNFIKKIATTFLGNTIGASHWYKFEHSVKQRVLKTNETFDGYDVLIATAVGTADVVKKIKNKKKFYFIQGFENWDRSDEAVYATYNMGMTNIVVAKWLKEIVDEHSVTPAYLVSNCINTDVFFDKGESRRKHSLVFHYRSAEHKGPRYAFEVIRKLKDKYDDLIVDVISKEDKPESLPEFCNFYHSISASEIAKINNQTEVFMCTSVEEGFGLPGLEAMACGCALVSSSYRGVLEYAVDGENALLSPVKDVDVMINNIEKLFEDNELRNRITENGVKTGKNRSLEESAKEFERILIKDRGLNI